MPGARAEPRFFKTQAELRRWLTANHGKANELVIGFYKKGSIRQGVTYREALDEALCFGWIDGVRHRIDDERYSNRFTPRRARSFWSAVNIARVGELRAMGRMHPAGIAVFDRRDQARTDRFESERAGAVLTPAEEKTIKATPKAWEFLQTVAPSYRRSAIWWIAQARKPETRRKRLQELIRHSARGRRVPPLTTPARRSVKKPVRNGL